jgi:aspartyl-tRNA synthetase
MADAPAEPAPQAPPAATPAAAEGEGAEGEKVSKKGAKKAEAKAKKEAEKARKAAEREAAEAAKKAAGGDAGEDLAKDNYGPITPSTALAAPVVKLSDISEEHVGKSIQVSGWVQRTRMQGVKMCFIEFRANRGWTVQGVIAASGEGKPVSRPMVKWIGSVSPESYVLIEATVQKPLEPVKSCRVSDFELHVTKLYLIAAAPRELGMSLATSNRPITSFEDDEPVKAAADDKADAAVEEVQQGVENVSINTVPGASLATHLANVVLHKRAPAQQAIAYCRKAVRKLFAEYLEERGFTQFEPPCLIGAASEGGGNVFGMPYFEKTAYLAQSPQFYKQFEIAAGFERVYSIGPVFRAENSNTPRHLTEVCCFT